MSISLLVHEEGCTPVNPCRSCKALSFLRTRLNEEEIATFLSHLGVETGGKKVYSRDNPIPLDAPIKELGLTIRVSNGLLNENVQTVGDLVGKTEADVLRMVALGHRALREIKEQLSMMGQNLLEQRV